MCAFCHTAILALPTASSIQHLSAIASAKADP